MQPKTVYMIVITLVLMGGLILLNKVIKSEFIDTYPYIFGIAFLIIAHFLSMYIMKRRGER